MLLGANGKFNFSKNYILNSFKKVITDYVLILGKKVLKFTQNFVIFRSKQDNVYIGSWDILFSEN